ncbi:DUF4350 domain-containing protein [Chitinophaga ginsengisoli]|uniref:Uncharacterized protein DUF4350 n=1 Tax=Chitinophaga ginsengisoli TaxID=363837 RepID=A0A2P8G6U9_9BACT|nr:DUF4350 domain-containing protein [Chitinophaga ginsengisoli]PSL29686.1 uncharacterized protein DUF4350 [Chitinophaga ginsengisoli]
MKSKLIAIISAIILVFLILLVFSSRTRKPDGKNIDEKELSQQSFSHKDKSPGGCYVMFKALSHLFYYDIKPQIVTKPFSRTYNKDETLASTDYNLYILVADRLYTSAEDAKNMIKFASAGNQLFIASNRPDSMLLEYLNITVDDEGIFQSFTNADQRYVNRNLAPDTAFSRKGIRGGSFVVKMDTSRTTILGTDAFKRPNFVKVAVGEGAVFLLLQPSTLTNYFLLHKRNIVSLERQLAYTNLYMDHVYWDEFYKYQSFRQSSDFSEWEVLMRYPAMRWALWLAVALLLIYMLFESKRRQRIIPEKPVLVNNSLEFVEALGQLYYQQHDNRNLAQKIILQWQEFVRTRYYLNTNSLDNAFAEALSRKAVMPLEQVKDILNSIQQVQSGQVITDEYLQRFYKNIQAFYLNTK